MERDRRLLRNVERDITCSTVEVGAAFTAAFLKVLVNKPDQMGPS